MSTRKNGRNGRKRGNGSTGKENGNGSRYTVVVGEDFLDLKQPIGRIKSGVLWVCGIVVGALIATLVSAFATPLANMLVEKLFGAR